MHSYGSEQVPKCIYFCMCVYCILFLQVCQDFQVSGSVILPAVNNLNSPDIHVPELSCTSTDKSTMTDTTSKMIQDVEESASNLQEQVSRLEQEKK